jgi:predicted dehydrogenase
LGFIGGGVNSAVGYAHYCASQLDGRWQLVAGAFSRDSDSNQESARSYQVNPENCYAQWEDLLANESLDAVAILTPTDRHEAIIRAALDRGVMVICEKSLTDSLLSAERIKASCQRTKTPLVVTYNYTGYPMVRELRARVKAGELGKIRHIQCEMPQEGFARLMPNGDKPKPQAWRLKDGEIATIHLDLTAHLHHLVHYLTGLRGHQVLAKHNTFGWFDGIVDDANVLAEYEQGLACHFWVSKSALGYKNGMRLRVMGDKAAFFWQQTQPEELHLHTVGGRAEIIQRGNGCLVANEPEFNRFKPGHPSGFIEAFANLYRDFAQALQQNRQQLPSAVWADYGVDTALDGIRFMHTLTTSHQSQQWEAVYEPSSIARLAKPSGYSQHDIARAAKA